MKKIIITLVLLSLIGTLTGIYLFNKPLESVSSMKSDYTIKASDLLSAFEDDESLANSKYLDKILEVGGRVNKVEHTDGKTTIYLDADNPMSFIIFQLEEKISTIQAGEVVTLKGVCTGYLMDVVMVRAIQV